VAVGIHEPIHDGTDHPTPHQPAQGTPALRSRLTLLGAFSSAAGYPPGGTAPKTPRSPRNPSKAVTRPMQRPAEPGADRGSE
jgi:hypothetical protein